MEYTTKDFKEYLLIGKDKDGKRFRSIYKSYVIANAINIYIGNLYGIKQDGKRIKLKSIYN